MIRAGVEKQTGNLSDEIWMNTCKIASDVLLARRRLGFRNTKESVAFLCTGIADATLKGRITGDTL